MSHVIIIKSEARDPLQRAWGSVKASLEEVASRPSEQQGKCSVWACPWNRRRPTWEVKSPGQLLWGKLTSRSPGPGQHDPLSCPGWP